MTTKYLVADTETSGLGPEAKVCEIGFFELDAQGAVVDQRESLIDCQCSIAPGASATHGLVYDDVKSSPTIDEWFSEDDPTCYGRRLQADKVVFIAHKAEFDLPFFAPYIDGEVQPVCTLRLARSVYPDLESHTLGALVFALDLPRAHRNAHRVLSDVTDCHNLVQHLMQRLGCSLDGLAELCQQPFILRRMTFGKHRGQRFEDIPTSYMKWMVNNIPDLDVDTRHTIAHYLSN